LRRTIRSFKRGLWGSCVARLMPRKGVSVIEVLCGPPTLFPFHGQARSILNRLSPAQKSPRLATGALFSSRIRCLSPYRNAGLSTRVKLVHANALGGGRDYQFHPDGIRTL